MMVEVWILEFFGGPLDGSTEESLELPEVVLVSLLCFDGGHYHTFKYEFMEMKDEHTAVFAQDKMAEVYENNFMSR